MLKVFPVDVLSHGIVETVSIGALFAKVQRPRPAEAGLVGGHLSLFDGIDPRYLLVQFVLVKHSNVDLQGSLVGDKCAVRTVEKNFILNQSLVRVAEVILVTRVGCGRKLTFSAAVRP